jgi:hypothetical protein
MLGSDRAAKIEIESGWGKQLVGASALVAVVAIWAAASWLEGSR